MLEGAVSHSHCTAIPAARRLVNLSGGAMDHEMESDAKALAGVVQEAGAADIHAYGSNKSLTNVVASDGENRWRTALEMRSCHRCAQVRPERSRTHISTCQEYCDVMHPPQGHPKPVI